MTTDEDPRTMDEAVSLIEQLRAQVRNFADFVENGAVGLHWVDRDGIIIWANQAELELLGYAREDYVGRHIRDVHVDKHAVEDILHRLSLNETLHNYPATLSAHDGSIRHVLITSNVRWEDGRFGHTRCFTRDITDIKAAEDALRQSEDRRRLAMQAAKIGTWEYDLTSGAVVWTGVESIHGVPEGSFGGSFEAYLSDVHPEDRECVTASISTAIQDETPLEMEYRIVRPDGETRWVRGLGQLDRAPGQPRRMVGICMDIHAQRKAFDAEKRERKVAEEANRVKDEFLATVSHELRTPLNAIMGWAEMLLRGQLKPERVNHALVTIAANAKRQSILIEDLLDVSRITSGKVHLVLAETDVEGVVRSAIEVTAPAAEAKDVSVTLEASPKAGPIIADGGRLNQVIWNLLSNAVKFTPGGGQVRVSVSRTAGTVSIRVRDTGIGIAPDFLPFVFTPFRQADATYGRAFGGLGLGLAIAKHLVELHGGTIAAESEGTGRGATFTVELPTRQAAAAARTDRARGRKSPRVPAIQRATPELDDVRVLVIDDEHDARELLKEFLTSRGAEVMVAASAAQADQILLTWKPTVMLVDLAMPEEDGCSFYTRWTARCPPRDVVPAVALTAHTTPADHERTSKAGFTQHLRKPVELEAVARAVAALAEKSHA